MDEPTTPVPTRHATLDPAAMAPHVERRWVESFVIEQRILGVPGDRIGDALATVEAHVLESGESGSDAFGDPRTYARELAASEGGRPGGVDANTIAGSLLGLVALLLVPRALGAWLGGTAVSVTVADLVIALVLVALLIGLFTAADAVLRLLVDHRWVGFLVVPALVAAFVAVLVTARGELATPSAALVGGVGVLAMLGQVAVLWRQPTDEIVEPGAARLGAVRHGAQGRHRVLALVLGPGLVALMCLLTWVLHLAA